MLCYGERYAAIVDVAQKACAVRELPDWIISAHVLTDGSVSSRYDGLVQLSVKVAVIFGRNQIAVYGITTDRSLAEQPELESHLEHRAVMYNVSVYRLKE